ncbi:hypothetical protein [Acidisphaera sp. L21]|uniref:hypothetical protein n=1 Tax=Acidisphaera sp. L21 TaxID=1641851 RepID=UPI00131D0F61|nr:hypothetical protein [Acidisphaera sp. L21]
MMGRLGKGFVFGAVLVVCGCSGTERYVGSVTTEQGACGPGFDAGGKANAVLTVRGKAVQFAPTDGVILLTGDMTDAGHVVVQNSAPGADRKLFQQVFEGDRKGDAVTGRFATPRCRANVVLSRR